ncbi:MAG: hypothetical protein ACRD1N_09015 [Terriglobia bacterium]
MRPNQQWMVILFALTLAAGTCWSQDTAPQQANPAGGAAAPGAPVQTVTSPGTPSSSPKLQPDTHPLGGAYLFSLGSALEQHSYFQPEFSIFEGAQTNAQQFVPGSSQGTLVATLPTVELSLTHNSRTNSLSAAYLGGGVIYDNSPSFSTSFHMANLSDSIQFRRWALNLGDQFTYLPSASYGFGGMGIPGGIGAGFSSGFGFAGGLGGLGQINPAFTASQSILTSQFGAYSNTSLAELGYSASPRTSVTFTGLYGTLQAGKRGQGFISSNQAFGVVGVNRVLTARDTISVDYTYWRFGYVGLPESFYTQMVELAYGRKITGRLSFQAYGGPELMRYQTRGLGSTSRTYATATGALSYQRGKNVFGIYAGRYATAGSGVLAGATTTMVDLNWARQVTRKWSMSVYGGNSRNSGLLTSAGLSSSNTHFDYWFGNAVVTHAISRFTSLFISYEYQRQASSSTGCRGEVCALGLARQMFGVGITFTPRPRGL